MAGLLSPESGAAMSLLGAGLLQGNFGGGLAAASQYASGLPEQKLRAGLLQAQLNETQAQAQERAMRAAQLQAEQQRMAKIRQSLPSLYRQSGMTGGAPAPQTMGGVEMFSKPVGVTPMQATPGGFDVQRAIELGMDPKMIQEYAGLQNLGRQEVARTVNVPGPNGEKMVMQLDKYGQPVGKPMTEFEAAQFLSLGDRQVATIPRPGMSLPVGMSPEARASNALGWANNALARRGQDLADARSRESMAFQREKDRLDRTSGGSASEGERKAATLLQRLEGSQRQLSEALKTNPSAAKPELMAAGIRGARLPLLGGIPGAEAIANTVTSEERQRVEAAQLDMLDAALTLGTGAAYTREQLEGYRKSYFPQIGDDAETVRDKQARLNNVIEAARIAAGRAATKPAAGGASGGWSIQKVN